MKSKKIIIVAVLATLFFVLALFLGINAFSYLSSKNSCIQNNSNSNGYSLSLIFDLKATQPNIDKFINESKNIPGVKTIQIETKDEALQKFIQNNQNNPEILKSLNDLSGNNPMRSSAKINSSINNIDDFLKFEQLILEKVKEAGLENTRSYDGRLAFFQSELAKVKKASLAKDFLSYLFSREGSHFFEKKYSVICGSAFMKK